MNPPRVRFAEVSKSYPGVQALRGVTLDVAPGSVHALVGENGAGKSTLMKVLAGAERCDAGWIELDGRRVAFGDPRDAQRAGIAIVYQEFSLAPHLTAAENVLLGRWPGGPLGLVRQGRLRAEAERVFSSIGMNVPLRARVESLSVAQQQMVEIARALSLDARVLVLDEPSAVLTPAELARLFGVVRELRGRGVSILYISHRLEEIFELADTVSVLRDGQHVSTRPVAQVTRRGLIEEMVGRPLEAEFPVRPARCGLMQLRVAGLGCPGRFRQVSFHVRYGEVFALTGLVGSGRSSVAKALFGAARGVTGRVRVGDTEGPFTSPRAAQRAGVAFVPEDRKREGLLLLRALRENLTLAHRTDSAVLGFFGPGTERRNARAQIERLRIRAASTEVPAGTLSGGNQQKAMLARWLARPYGVMILDEPTRGVDVGAKFEIYTIINAIAAAGTAVLMVTSELPEAIGMADRIGVMCRGRLAGVLNNENHAVTQEQIMQLAVGENP